MSHPLVNHSDDLQKLVDEELVIEIRNEFLFIYRIPYLDSNRQVQYGTLVSNLQVSGNRTVSNPDHTVYFAGEMPHDLDGSPLTSIINNSNQQTVADGFKVNHYMSSKPKPNGYTDYYHKMTTYIDIISGPAKAVDKSITEKGNRKINNHGESVFQYMNTNASKPELSSLNNKFKEQKVAIVGLGGTGSYILDLISKVPVKEIHLYDGDWFYNNNAFRAPGAASIEDLNIPQKKTDYLAGIYSKMHKGIISHPEYLTSEDVNKLENYDFVFLSLDKGELKKEIIELLEDSSIPFVDVGMGIHNKNNSLTGLLRVTTGTPSNTSHIWETDTIPFSDDLEDEYDSNIQIAELNSLNAALAVLKWKKLNGFYQNLGNEFNMFYRINSNKILNE